MGNETGKSLMALGCMLMLIPIIIVLVVVFIAFLAAVL